MTALATVPDEVSSYATGIADTGQIRGVLELSPHDPRYAVWEDGKVRITSSDFRQSFTDDRGRVHAPEPGKDYEVSPSSNRSGTRVGSYQPTDFQKRKDWAYPTSAHAAIWQGGKRFDLNDCLVNGSGWVLTEARGINNLGEIAGTGVFEINPKFHDRIKMAFLPEPVPAGDSRK